MKRINIILASETEPDNNGVPETFQPAEAQFDFSVDDLASKATTINTLLAADPSLAETPEFKNLMEISNAIKEDIGEVEEPQSSNEQFEPEEGAEQTQDKPEKGKAKKEEASSNEEGNDNFNPFAPAEEYDFSKTEIKDLETVMAESFGVNTKKSGWLGNFLTQTKENQALIEELKGKADDYDGFMETLNSMPKELQMAIRAFADGQDWKLTLNSGSVINYGKDFDSLTKAEKIAAHNYYFSDEPLTSDADLEDKGNAKIMKMVERSFKEDKNRIEKARIDSEKKAEERRVANNAAFEKAVSAAKKKFPKFPEREFRKVVETAKSGVHNFFFDKNGIIKEDALVKLLLASNGEVLLNNVANISKSKGKNEGKREVIQTKVAPPKGGGGTPQNFTTEDDKVKSLVSSMSNKLTY